MTRAAISGRYVAEVSDEEKSVSSDTTPTQALNKTARVAAQLHVLGFNKFKSGQSLSGWYLQLPALRRLL